jgi:hypothetical protein
LIDSGTAAGLSSSAVDRVAYTVQYGLDANFGLTGQNMKTFRIPLRVIFYKEDGSWVAHCLEFDLCGDGPTKEEALRSLFDSIKIQAQESFHHDNLRNLFTPASSEVQEKFFAGKHTTIQGEMKLTIEPLIIEEAEYREYSDEAADALRSR